MLSQTPKLQQRRALHARLPNGASVEHACIPLCSAVTVAFWTVDSREVANILTYGGVQAGQYTLGVYAAWYRDLMIYVVPLGCVTYFPVVTLLGRHDTLGAPDWLGLVSPVFGVAFLGVALWVWGFGVRRYTSTGS